MLGLRYAFTQPHQQNWMTDGTMDWLWPAAEKAGIPIALMASNYLPQVGQIAERHPRLKLILDHYARVRDGKDDAAHGNQAALLALAKYPNVAVKCTGAPGNSSQPYPYRNIHKYTQQIVETFGPQRSFWGTDIDEGRRADFPFGAVIVQGGRVLARGRNLGRSQDDPTAHGEMVAIRRCLAQHGSRPLKGATLYTSGEPCAMCMGAILWSHMGRLVFAASVQQLATRIDQILLSAAAVAARAPVAPVP